MSESELNLEMLHLQRFVCVCVSEREREEERQRENGRYTLNLIRAVGESSYIDEISWIAILQNHEPCIQ